MKSLIICLFLICSTAIATPFTYDHDVGCTQVISPPEGYFEWGWCDVVGNIHNFGTAPETFEVRAIVYDTTNWSILFDQTTTVTDLPPGAGTVVNFGTCFFLLLQYFYIEIYTTLAGDENPANDTSSIHSRTAHILGDIIYELDVEAICNDNQLLGLECDGERFYITGGNNGVDPNKVYVVDTSGTLLLTVDQPPHCTGWGWRDLAWDFVYTGPDRIDTLYASGDPNIDYFGIDFITGSLVYHHFSPGAEDPNRALAYRQDSAWFYAANFTSPCYRFGKSGGIMVVPNTYAMYGAAYDYHSHMANQYVWWHSQDDPGTGFDCQISQMDPYDMSFLGVPFGFSLPAALTDAVAGGLCYVEGFGGWWPGIDVLFALLQGTPHDYIVGIYLRGYIGIDDDSTSSKLKSSGFTATMPTMTRDYTTFTYTTHTPGFVSLEIYDCVGRLVRILAQGHDQAGLKAIHWNGMDEHNSRVPSGCYFVKLTAGDKVHVKKIILLK